MKGQVYNVSVVTPTTVIEKGVVGFVDGVIDYVGKDLIPDREKIDGNNGFLLAGFIDIHCHGGNGYDFMDADIDGFEEISRFHLSHGTTTLFATTMASCWEETENALKTYANHKEKYPNSTLCGVHMEGPWFSAEGCGAQKTEYFVKAKPEQIERLKKEYPFIKRVSVAPEVDQDFKFGKRAKELDVVVSVAHTGADFSLVEKAKDNGYSLMTHLYSGMNGVHRVNAYRVAGAVEAGLYFDQLDVEIIADGKHLPNELLRLIYKCKGADKICLITDGTRACGFNDGERSVTGSLKNGTACIVEDGVAKMPDRTGFAGSVATTDRLMKTMHELEEVDIINLSKMASSAPARVMGLADRGEIAVGKRADLVLTDKNLNILSVIYNGEIK